MSNLLRQELCKLFADGTIIHDPVLVGRACLGSLDRDRQVRVEFVTLGHADHYTTLRLTLLDNNHGMVDKLILRFRDAWGEKKIPNNPYLRDGVVPHIWMDGDRIDWCTYHPFQEDYQQLRQIASDYAEAFRIQVLTKNHGPRLVYVCAPFRDEPEKNIVSAEEKTWEVFQAGDVPIRPHLMFSLFADPDDPAQDQAMQETGLRLVKHRQQVNVYGTVHTPGIPTEIRRAEEPNIPVKADQPGLKEKKDRPRRGQIRQEVKWQKSRQLPSTNCVR